MTAPPAWIAVDWGTSSLRAWAMGPDGTILAEAANAEGMGTLAPDQFEGALLRLIDGWLQGPTPVVIAGTAGARQGWHEAPYRAVPCRPVDPGALVAVPTADPRLSVRIVPGLSQSTPPDVLRGEEVQIAGLLALHPAFDGVACLPGTHTKWARLSAGEVAGFRTAMTGELFGLLSTRSLLRHSMGDGLDLDAFDAALADGMARPEALALRLFAIRADSLLAGLSPAAARGRLSGLLIGAELAATRAWWLGQDVMIIGAPAVAGLYDRALRAQGLAPRSLPADRAALAGLALARGTA